MSESCKRHRRGALAGWMPVDTHDGRIWAIAEAHYCARCGASMDPRIVRGTIKRTQRAAMEAYGLPQDVIDGFFPPAPPSSAPAIAMPLSCWPFPTSTWFPQEAT